jgi:mersacidin/lichenicidin family type 2 lantibiotic
MKKLDIARAIKDRDYFDSLSPEQQAVVSAMNPAGVAEIGDAELETVTGGLEGGYAIQATTTTSDNNCSCGTKPPTKIVMSAARGCSCDC